MDFSLLSLKIFAIVVMMAVAAIGCLLPLALNRKNTSFIQFINSFAGGTMFALSLCHLIPEAEEMARFNGICFHILGVEVPIVSYLTFIGFAAILFVEKALFSPNSIAQFHVHDHAHLHEIKGNNNITRHASGDLCSSAIVLNEESVDCDAHCCEDLYGKDDDDLKEKYNFSEENLLLLGIRDRNSADACLMHECVNRDSDSTPLKQNRSHSICMSCNSNSSYTKNMILASGSTMVEISNDTSPEHNFKIENGYSVKKKEDEILLERTTIDMVAKSEILVENEGDVFCDQKNKHSHHYSSALIPLPYNAYFLVSALALHSLFEGMLVGMSTTPFAVWTTTMIVIAHKWVEGIAVAAGVSKHRNIKKKSSVSAF